MKNYRLRQREWGWWYIEKRVCLLFWRRVRFPVGDGIPTFRERAAAANYVEARFGEDI